MDRETTVDKQKKDYALALGEKEVNDFERHLFDVKNFGGEIEAENLIQHYTEKHGYISEDDKAILRNNIPPAPKFTMLSEDQYRAKTCFGKSSYRKQVKGYFEARKNFYTAKSKKGQEETKGTKYTRLREELDSDDFYRYQKSDQAKQMDKMFEEQATEAFKQKEQKAKAEDMEKMKKTKDISAYLDNYINSNDYASINQNLRAGFPNSEAEEVKKYMKENPLNRTLMVRRAVRDVNAIGNMLGMNVQIIPGWNGNNYSEEKIKNELLKRIKSKKEIILQDKGYVSTSLPFATEPFSAGDNGIIGIEFIIRCNKGTAAFNVEDISLVGGESELLLAPGTKFRLIDAQLDGKADIKKGNKKSWKIYLETIPVSEEGVEKKEDNKS